MIGNMRVPTAYELLLLPHLGLLVKSLFLGLELLFALFPPCPSVLDGFGSRLPLIWSWHFVAEVLPSKLCFPKTQLGLVVGVKCVALQVGRHRGMHRIRCRLVIDFHRSPPLPGETRLEFPSSHVKYPIFPVKFDFVWDLLYQSTNLPN